MWGLHLQQPRLRAHPQTSSPCGPCATSSWRCQKAISSKLNAAGGAGGDPSPLGSTEPGLWAPGKVPASVFIAVVIAKVLILGRGMQAGILLGFLHGRRTNSEEGRLALVLQVRTTSPRRRGCQGGLAEEPARQQTREDALWFSSTLPCLLNLSCEARFNLGGKQGSEPRSTPRGPAWGMHRRSRGGPAEPCLPKWAGLNHRSRTAREEGKISTDPSGCDDKHGGASEHIAMREFCMARLCIWFSSPEAAKIKRKLIYF